MIREYKQGDLQRIMLKTIMSNGGKATSKDIWKSTDIPISSVPKIAQHLENRGLIKITLKKIENRKILHFQITRTAMPKIKRLISELEQ